MPDIIVVEDDEHLRYGLKFNLEKDGFVVRDFGTAEEGRDAWRLKGCDLILSDIMLPGISGLELLEEIRKEDQVPFVMLTARSDESDAVLALDLGADDYVRKPFGVSELIARLHRILRRSVITRPAAETLGPWTLDLENYRVNREEESVQLTNIEAGILEELLKNPGAVVARETLLESVWGPGMSSLTRTLDNHIARLRRKIEVDAKNPLLVLTVHGIGYKIST